LIVPHTLETPENSIGQHLMQVQQVPQATFIEAEGGAVEGGADKESIEQQYKKTNKNIVG
jgi:hypothetical protein